MEFESLHYTGMPLDRQVVKRKDPVWLARQQQHPDALFLPLLGQRNLVILAPDTAPSAGLLRLQTYRQAFLQAEHTVYLGQLQERPVFCARLRADTAAPEPDPAAQFGAHAQFVDLRSIGVLLPQAQGAMLAYARGMLYWHAQHVFCSCCGHATVSRLAGHLRVCGNPDCRYESYPRINPAVIMLVEQLEPADGVERCLLGRHTGLPRGVYSTLAGYVDPGESLEEAVAREVMEEAGIRIHSADYLASQPWPFPSAMMFGFRARARHTAITLVDGELEDARWFTRAELLEFGEYEQGGDGRIALPRKDSIARNLIEFWLRRSGP